MKTIQRAIVGFVAVVAGALLLAVPAFAATPGQIYKDYADNGKLDAKYSQADLQRAFKDASVQGYGSPVVIIKMRRPQGAPIGGSKTKGGGTTDYPIVGGNLVVH